jgi:hypothetical protein
MNTEPDIVEKLVEIASLMVRGQLTQPRKVGAEIRKIAMQLRAERDAARVSLAAVEALKPFAKYQMGMVGIADVVRRQDFKGFAWVAAFNGPTQPEFRHFEAARAVITQSRNDHEGSQS